MSQGHHLGFQSLHSEVSGHQPPIDGEIPRWLSGTLIRNGPGRFDVGGQRLGHWFDGLAMLRRYEFDDGTITYANRYLRTEAYDDAMDGSLTGQFGTDRRGLGKLMSWMRALGPPEITDNANVHVARFDGDYVALTEAPRRVSFDPITLETRGPFRFADSLAEHLAAAHLVADSQTDEWFGFTTEFGRTARYHLYRVDPGRRARDRVASVSADGPAYIHDCSITSDHLILVEPPLVMPIHRALSPFTEGVVDLLDWQPERGTRVLVVDRETGELVADPTLPPLFTFHHINAFATETEIVLDLVEFPDASIIDTLRLEELADDEAVLDAPDGKPVRYRIDPGRNDIDRSTIASVGVELPRIPRGIRGREHRYAYAQATDPAGANGLVKLDCRTGDTTTWVRDGTYVEEPIPVRRPNAQAADDGVVIAPALDGESARTNVLVFDAADLTLLAEAPLPHVEPFGFHGRFFPDL